MVYIRISGRSGHGQRAGANSIADTLRSVVAAVASAAVNLSVWSVVQVGAVQGALAVHAGEAASVPNTVLRVHLFGGVDSVAAAGATAFYSLLTAVWPTVGARK